MPTWLYVAMVVVGLAAAGFGITRPGERLDDAGRPVYGWTLVVLGLLWAGLSTVVLWKRSQGERSRLEDM